MTPVIDKTYKLNETADALRYLERHARGKVVIALNRAMATINRTIESQRTAANRRLVLLNLFAHDRIPR